MGNDYIIGADKPLREIVKEQDVMPLLEEAVSAGAAEATLEDDSGNTLYRWGSRKGETDVIIRQPVFHEGETTGYITISGDRGKEDILRAAGGLVFRAVNTVLKNSFRTILATETHRTVVDQSYKELFETNRRLQISENKYRELAGSLEKKVQERTEELERAHTKLLHQEKIASVGQLAAGIAHEINNPVGFVASNLGTLRLYISKFKDMLFSLRDVINDEGLRGMKEFTNRRWRDLKLDFIMSDVDELIEQSLEGMERVKKIVSDLKGFSHVDDTHITDVDINREIDRVLNVLSHEIPEDAEIIRDYSTIPVIACNASHLCQALFNVILNALQARGEGLRLVVTTGLTESSCIRIIVADNGPGIPPDIRHRIFEPFFTTKDVGKGTGMGLNVTYDIITSYNGSVEVENNTPEGTRFIIEVPCRERDADVQVR